MQGRFRYPLGAYPPRAGPLWRQGVADSALHGGIQPKMLSTLASESFRARDFFLFYTSIGSVSVKAHYQPLEAG